MVLREFVFLNNVEKVIYKLIFMAVGDLNQFSIQKKNGKFFFSYKTNDALFECNEYTLDTN